MKKNGKTWLGTLLLFLMTYLCVLIPVLIVSFSISDNAARNLDNRMREKQEGRLEQFDAEMQLLQQTYCDRAMELANNHKLKYDKMQDRATAVYGVDELRYVSGFDTNSIGIIMYYGDGGAYTDRGYAKLQVYLENTMLLDETSITDVQALFESDDFGTCLCTNKNMRDGYLLFHYPAKIISYGRGAESVNFLMRYSTLAEYLATFSDYENCMIRLSQADERSIFFGGRNGKISLNLSGSYPDETDYLVSEADIKGIGLHIEVLYDTDEIGEVVSSLRRNNMLLLIFAMLLSAVISILISSWRVRQLTELGTQIKNGFANEKKRKTSFEYELVRQTLMSTLYEKNVQIGERDSHIRRHTAYIMLNGLVTDRGLLNRMLRPCGIELFEQYYYVMAVSADGTKAAWERVCAKLENTIYYDEYDEQNGKLLLYVFSEASFMLCDRESAAANMRMICGASGLKSSRIGVSCVYDNYAMLRLASKEAEEVLREADFSEKSAVLWEDVERDRRKNEAETLLAGIPDMIVRKDVKAIMRTFRKVRQTGEDCETLRRDILRLLNDNGLLYGVTVDREMFDDLPEDAFFQRIEKLIAQCFSETDMNERFDAVLNYIAAHYTESSLSAEEVSEHTGIDKAHLSRIFRSKLDMTYIDYLTSLRMERVCELLKTTELSVQDICRSVGYIDLSSFRRKFKLLYKQNISQYREQYRQSEEEEES